MANISLTLYTNGFFGLVLKSPTQMGSLSIKKLVTNISRLGTFKDWCTKYIHTQSTTVYVPRWNWDSPTPSLVSECAPPPGTKGLGGGTLACG
jgi:hypothetical protein